MNIRQKINLFSFPLWNVYFSLKEQCALFALVILGMIVRVINALYTPLWRDEIYIFFISRNNSLWKLIMQQHWDTAHPPLHSIFLHFWQMVSIQPFWLRLPSLILSFFILYLVPILAIKIMRKYKLFPFIFLFVFSLSHTQISLNMVARPYPFVLLFTIISMVLFLTMIETRQKNNKLTLCFAFVNFLAIQIDYSAIWLFASYCVFFPIYHMSHRKKGSPSPYIFRGILLTFLGSLTILPLLLGNLKNSLVLEKQNVNKFKPIVVPNKVVMSLNLAKGIIFIKDGNKIIGRAYMPENPFPGGKMTFSMNMPAFSAVKIKSIQICSKIETKSQCAIKKISTNNGRSYGKYLHILKVPDGYWLINLGRSPINEIAVSEKIRVGSTFDLIIDIPFSTTGDIAINLQREIKPDTNLPWWKDIHRISILPKNEMTIYYYDGTNVFPFWLFHVQNPLLQFKDDLIFFTGLFYTKYFLVEDMGLCVSSLILLLISFWSIKYLLSTSFSQSLLLIMSILPLLLSILISIGIAPIFVARNLYLVNICYLLGISLLLSKLLEKRHPTLMIGSAFFFFSIFLLAFPKLLYVDPQYDMRTLVNTIQNELRKGMKTTLALNNYPAVNYGPLFSYNLLIYGDPKFSLAIKPISYNEYVRKRVHSKKAKAKERFMFVQLGSGNVEPVVENLDEIMQNHTCKFKLKKIDFIFFALCS